MTTGITAVGGGATQVLPRRLAVVVLVAITTFSVARFVTFSTVVIDAPRARRLPRASTTSQQQIAELEASAQRDPDNATTWQQLGGAYLHRAIETADPAFYDLSGRALDRADALVPDQADDDRHRGALLLSLHEFGAGPRPRRAGHACRTRSTPTRSPCSSTPTSSSGRYDDAATTLQQLLDLRPGLPAYSRASYLRELHGDLVGAEQAMRQALTAGAGDRLRRRDGHDLPR